jgi:hypothetical protein
VQSLEQTFSFVLTATGAVVRTTGVTRLGFDALFVLAASSLGSCTRTGAAAFRDSNHFGKRLAFTTAALFAESQQLASAP